MEPFTFFCGECECSFEPDPQMVVQMFWRDIGDKEVGDMEYSLTTEELETADEEDLASIGLTCADRDALLAGGKVPAGAAIICCGCQDRLASE